MSNKKIRSTDRSASLHPMSMNSHFANLFTWSPPSFIFQFEILEAISAFLYSCSADGSRTPFPSPLAICTALFNPERPTGPPRSPDMIFHVAERILYESREKGTIPVTDHSLKQRPELSRWPDTARYSPRMMGTGSWDFLGRCLFTGIPVSANFHVLLKASFFSRVWN